MKNLSKFLAIPALALTLIPTNVFAASETANVKVSIPESLTLSLSTNALNFNLEDTDLHTDKLVVTAKTNAASGYTISFNANNDYNDLKHSNTLVEDLIPSVIEDKTEATFPETAWAYSTDISDYTFKKIPLVAENIFTTTEKGENTHNFTVGVRANNLAAGDYENELIFTAVANPESSLTLADITTMQEITPEIVAATPEHGSKQLIDVRDNKSYWVTKLKDGNIWMTQNLDYDLSVAANQTLTPATSNVTENRTVTPVASWEWYEDSIYYMDGGDNYFANGTTQTAGLASLPENSIDRHYAQGDYYSWKAATAGQGTPDITDVDVNESICPAGWRLPTSKSADANYSFNNLVKQYGYSGDNQYSGVTDATLLASPLFFARGGFVRSGLLDYQGRYGDYWSSSASSGSSTAYDLYFGSSYVEPSNTDGRSYGFSVRCVAL